MLSFQVRAQAEIERRHRIKTGIGGPPGEWQPWLQELFPNYVTHPFAPRHVELWNWLSEIWPGIRPRPFVALWPRGGAKSTSAELGVVWLGAHMARKYTWYVSSTQEKADKHVENIGTTLESSQVERYYPDLASRKVNKYGSSRGWRRNRLRTAKGLTIDAVGLDTGARGAKVEEQRPDFIVLDDFDELEDSIAVTMKKIRMITQTILPAGSNDCAVLVIQNLVAPDSIASQLGDGRADWLLDKILSGPFPAVEGLAYEQNPDGTFRITAGTATWEGQSLDICQDQIKTWGISSFLKEAQHEVEQSGGRWDHIEFIHIDWDKLPRFVVKVVWVDPAVTSTDNSDCQGIMAGGLGVDHKIYTLFSWEGITSPEDALERAIRKAVELGAERVGVETDQGGDLWKSAYTAALKKIQAEVAQKWEEYIIDWKIKNPTEKKLPARPDIVWPRFVSDKAGSGYGSKAERNDRMRASYERGEVRHAIGTHSVLERALKRFPIDPLDLADAAFWVWNDLVGGSGWSQFFRDQKADRSKPNGPIEIQ